MNKKIQLLTTVVSGLAFIGVMTLLIIQLSTPKKIAYIQTDELLAEYKGMIEAKQGYEVKAVSWQSNIDTLGKELENMIAVYEANKGSLSKSKLQEEQKQLQQKQKQLNDYRQSISQQAQQEDAKLTEGVLNQVNTYIEDYGKEKGYKIIFGANGSGNIVYGSDAIDITNEILKGLNKEYNGGA
jgi:outer membrane protein